MDFDEKDYTNYWVIGFIALFIVSFLISVNSNSSPDLSRFPKLRVNVNFRLIRNDGVGNEFEYTAAVNDRFLSQGNVIDNTGSVDCFAKIVERDSYYLPDIGTGSRVCYLNYSNQCLIRIIVWEYGGVTNAGTSAEFNVTFTFTGYS